MFLIVNNNRLRGRALNDKTMKYTTHSGLFYNQILLLPTVSIERVFTVNVITFGFLFWYSRIVISRKQ